MELLYSPERLEDAELRSSFVPRQPSIDELTASLSESNLLLLGGPGAGKTTLLLMLHQALPDSVFLRCPEDLEAVRQPALLLIDDLDCYSYRLPGDCRIAATATQPPPGADGFQVHRLLPFDRAQSDDLLRRRAALDNRADFDDLLKRNRVRLEVLHCFTAGNPRLTLMLYRILISSEPVPLRRAVDYLLDSLTPVYRAHADALPPQPRRILECIASAGGRTGAGLTPSRIARDARLPANQVSVQLQRLTALGLLHAADLPGRHSYYSVADPLFAVWLESRRGRNGRRPVDRLLDFLQRWHANLDIAGQAALLGFRLRELLSSSRPNLADPNEMRRYLAAALAPAFRASSLERPLQIQILNALLESPGWSEIDAILDGLEEHFGAVPRLQSLRGLARARLGRPREALDDFDRSLAAACDDDAAIERVEVLLDLRRHNEAVDACDSILGRLPEHRPAQLLRALALAFTGRFDQALASAGPASSPAASAFLQALARLRDVAKQPSSLLRFLLGVESFDEARVVWGRLLASETHRPGLAVLAAQALSPANLDLLASLLPADSPDDPFLYLRHAIECARGPRTLAVEKLSAELRPVVAEILRHYDRAPLPA